MTKKITVSVGNRSGDIRGNTNTALQAAADYVAALGGGTVRVLEGEYLMYDSLRLKSGVSLAGDGADRTLLKKAGCAKSLLKATSGYGEDQIILCDPEGFEVGHGVAVFDDHAQGFLCTVGTIVEQTAEDTFKLNAAMHMDCMVEHNAMAFTVYPIVTASDCSDITIRDIAVDGNREQNAFLNGCRGGGIFLLNTSNIHIQNCLVMNYNGDGISYQNSHDVVVSECMSRGNAGLGIHPGSGSLRTIVRNCVASDNDSIGFYFCWRVRDGRVENCEFSNNKGAGISIGHRDTDNIIFNNRITNNKNGGIEFRNEDTHHAPHRTRIEGNVILDNGTAPSLMGINIQGEVSDVWIKGNTIGNQAEADGSVGVYLGHSAKDIEIKNNSFTNIAKELYKGV